MGTCRPEVPVTACHFALLVAEKYDKTSVVCDLIYGICSLSHSAFQNQISQSLAISTIVFVAILLFHKPATSSKDSLYDTTTIRERSKKFMVFL